MRRCLAKIALTHGLSGPVKSGVFYCQNELLPSLAYGVDESVKALARCSILRPAWVIFGLWGLFQAVNSGLCTLGFNFLFLLKRNGLPLDGLFWSRLVEIANRQGTADHKRGRWKFAHNYLAGREMARYEIPLSPDAQAFQIQIAEAVYLIRVHFAGGWLLDISNADGAPLVHGIP